MEHYRILYFSSTDASRVQEIEEMKGSTCVWISMTKEHLSHTGEKGISVCCFYVVMNGEQLGKFFFEVWTSYKGHIFWFGRILILFK